MTACAQGEAIRFNELRRIMPNITQRMLTKQLRELEEKQLILRTIYPEVPPKVEYKMTDFGSSLAPVIRSLRDWGEAYIDQLSVSENSLIRPIKTTAEQ